MPITLAESGFHEWHDHVHNGPAVAIDSTRVDECINRFHEGGFTGLIGSPSFGFDQEHLDFLANTPQVKWLWFWDVKLKNIDAVYHAKEVEYFGINPKRPGVDFSQFPKLNTVVNHWNKKDQGLAESTINTYHSWHYKPKSKAFDELELPRGVTEFYVYWANPTSLEHLPAMKKLTTLEFHRCRNLNDLSRLPEVAPGLKKLIVTTSSKVDPTAGVVDHPNLELAIVDGKTIVEHGKPCE